MLSKGDDTMPWRPLSQLLALEMHICTLVLLTWTACSMPTGKLPNNFLHVQVKNGCSNFTQVCCMIENLPLQWDIKRYLSGCPEEKIRPVHT